MGRCSSVPLVGPCGVGDAFRRWLTDSLLSKTGNVKLPAVFAIMGALLRGLILPPAAFVTTHTAVCCLTGANVFFSRPSSGRLGHTAGHVAGNTRHRVRNDDMGGQIGWGRFCRPNRVWDIGGLAVMVAPFG